MRKVEAVGPAVPAARLDAAHVPSRAGGVPDPQRVAPARGVEDAPEALAARRARQHGPAPGGDRPAVDPDLAPGDPPVELRGLRPEGDAHGAVAGVPRPHAADVEGQGRAGARGDREQHEHGQCESDRARHPGSVPESGAP